MRPVIFVVEDDSALVRLLHQTLEAEELSVRSFRTAAELLCQSSRPSLFLLDRGLPDLDGLALASAIRQSPLWTGVPIIFVTGRDSESECVEGLRIADDYVAKPFSTLELAARIHAVLRRSQSSQFPVRLRVGDLDVDTDAMTAQVRGSAIDLTALEFRLLTFLMSNPGKTFTRHQLLNRVWDARCVVPRTIDVHMRRLREKIELRPEAPQYLQTVRGRGYRMFSPTPTPVSLPSVSHTQFAHPQPAVA